MSKINLSDINPTGSELFQDADNLLDELNDQEMEQLAGGYWSGYGGDFINIQSRVANSIVGNSNGNAVTVVSFNG